MKQILVLESVGELLDVASRDRVQGSTSPCLPADAELVVCRSDMRMELTGAGDFRFSGGRELTEALVYALAARAGLHVRFS